MEDQWYNLPKDIVELISKNIISAEDYLRFRAVCNPWRSALSPNPRYLPPQSPWLMLPYNPNEGGNEDSTRLFYDISSSQIRKINLPETCGKQYCGSSKGWLMLQKGPEFSLLNPITKAQINLPSLETPPKLLGVENFEPTDDIKSRLDVWPCRYGYNSGTGSIVQRTMLTSNPSLDPNCIVMALFKNNWELAFCRIGDKCWTILEVPEENRSNYFIDAIIQNDLFYCIFLDEMKIYNRDGSKREILKIFAPLEHFNYYLLEGNSDLNELILIAEHKGPYGHRTRELFSIYKFGTKDGVPSWIEIGGIGAKSFFICEDINQCFSLEGLRGNNLCYVYPELVGQYKFGYHDEREFSYNVKMGKIPNNQQKICMDLNWHHRDYWIKNVNFRTNFGSYPPMYSKVVWITTSLY